MPRSVLLLGSDPDLIHRVRAALCSDPRFIDLGDAVHGDGSAAPLTNLYPIAIDPVEWTGWESRASPMPDPRALRALVLECRSPAWIAEVGELLAQRLDSAIWFVDSADVVWPAGGVDPARIAL